MSESNVDNSSFPIDDYIEHAVDIQIANQVNGKQMDKLFHDMVAKAKEYRNQCRSSDAKIESMKQMIVAQWQQIRGLRHKLDETSKKLELAESTAKTNEIKYNQLYNKLKTIVLDTAAVAAADSCDNESAVGNA